MPTIRLQTSDEQTFDVDIQIAKCSGTICSMLEACDGEGDENAIVPLPNVSSTILTKVLAWADYHKNDPPLTEDDERKEKQSNDIAAWDEEFVAVDQSTLFELILAANYLDIKGLLELTCKNVANMIKDKSVEDIRKIFNIKKDFTPAEEKQVCTENDWCE